MYKKVEMNFLNILNIKNFHKLSEDLFQFSVSLEKLIKLPYSYNFPKQILTLIREHFKADICRYYEVNKGSENMSLSLLLPSEYKPLKDLKTKTIKYGAIGKAYKTRDITIIDNVKFSEKKKEYINIDNKIKSEVVIPILFLGEVIGIIIIDFFHKINKSEKLIYSIIGRLFRYFTYNSFEASNRDLRLNFLQKLPEKLNEGLDETLNDFFDLIHSVFGVKFLSYWLYLNVDNEELLILRSIYPFKIGNKEIKLDDFDTKIVKLNQSIYKNLFKEKTYKIYSDPKNIKEYHNKNFIDKFSLDWFISYPIFFNEKPIGILNYTPFQTFEEINQGDINTYNIKINELNTYVKILEIIHKLCNLFDIEHFLSNYDKVFSELQKFVDEKASWNNLSKIVGNLMNCEGCSIFLKNNDELVLKGTTGIIGDPDYNEVRYKKGEGLTGYAFEKENAFIFYKDFKNELLSLHKSKFREKIYSSAKSKSIILVPLKNDNEELIGLIRCNNKIQKIGFHFDRFTKEDEIKLINLSKLISNVYLKINSIRKFTEEWERNVYALHHELLSPVLGICNHSEWFKYQVKYENRKDWNLNLFERKFSDIEQNAILLDVLVNSMGNLDDIKINILTIDFLEILKMCKGFFKGELERHNIDFNWTYLDLPQIFRGDKVHLFRVFYNLLRNSIKYSDPIENKKIIRIVTKNKTDYLEFTIEDNGIGIIDGEEDIIFNKFRRGRNAIKYFPEGTGIGLTYCRKIIEAHKGRIFFDNNRKPTRIKFELYKHLN